MTVSPGADVLVVGAGNAALCAALAARESGARVLVLEKAPEHLRGGNTYFTGGAIRFAYNGIDDVRALVTDLSEAELAMMEVGSYPAAAFHSDVMRVTESLADAELTDVLVRRSHDTLRWLHGKGLRLVPMLSRQAFKVGEKYRFWGGLVLEAVGGGKGLSDQLFDLAANNQIEVRYQTAATKLLIESSGRVTGVQAKTPDGYQEIGANAVVLACGGFEANPEMRARYLGPGWELAKVRGVRYNTGDGINMALDIGAQPYGHWSGCHAVAWDLNAPPFGNRTITDLYQKHSYPFGIIVNTSGQRFVDEGADFRNYTYAKYGREILAQPYRVAFQIFDDKARLLLRDEYRIPQVTMAQSDTIEELARALDIDPAGLAGTVRQFNASCQPGDFNPAILDGLRTEGIAPPKSNWALPLDSAPYLGYAVTCGITFTFGGLRINRRAQVLDTQDTPIPGLYAAGELVGGLFYYNYPGGTGLMSGSVFGRTAGESSIADMAS